MSAMYSGIFLRCIFSPCSPHVEINIESALYRLEGGWIGDFYEFFTKEFAGEEIP